MAALTLEQLQTDLEDVRQAQRDAVKLGAQYSIAGSQAVTPQSLKALKPRETRLKAQIRAFRGIPSRSLPGSEGVTV